MFILSILLFYFCFASKYYGFSIISIIKRLFKFFSKTKKPSEVSRSIELTEEELKEVK